MGQLGSSDEWTVGKMGTGASELLGNAHRGKWALGAKKYLGK